MNNILSIGKIPNELLAPLLAQLPTNHPDVCIPPGIGSDAGAFKVGNNIVAVTTDPITLANHRIGTYSVSVNINDIACLGCKPQFYTGTLILPEGSSEQLLIDIWQDLVNALNQYNVIAIGGHTEVSAAVNLPILVGQMMGEPIAGQSLLSASNIKPGDKLLLWQPVAIEGTALLAQEANDYLQQKISNEQIIGMQSLLDNPGICVWPLVKKLLPHPGIVALHDPTEGGVASAIHELADGANCGVIIDKACLTIRPETALLADIFNLDPLGLLASGSLLIACHPEDELSILNQLSDEPISSIGYFVEDKSERILNSDKGSLALPRYARDELIVGLQRCK